MASPSTITVQPTRPPLRSGDEVRQSAEQILQRVKSLASDINSEISKIDDRLTTLVVPSESDATRGSAGTAGRIIFNTDDGQLNIDDGTQWTLPDGSAT